MTSVCGCATPAESVHRSPPKNGPRKFGGQTDVSKKWPANLFWFLLVSRCVPKLLVAVVKKYSLQKSVVFFAFLNKVVAVVKKLSPKWSVANGRPQPTSKIGQQMVVAKKKNSKHGTDNQQVAVGMTRVLMASKGNPLQSVDIFVSWSGLSYGATLTHRVHCSRRMLWCDAQRNTHFREDPNRPLQRSWRHLCFGISRFLLLSLKTDLDKRVVAVGMSQKVTRTTLKKPYLPHQFFST